MLKYEFKERKQTAGEDIKADLPTRVIAYRTGYAEFMVTKVLMGPHQEN
jgi:hypothetical protein